MTSRIIFTRKTQTHEEELEDTKRLYTIMRIRQLIKSSLDTTD